MGSVEIPVVLAAAVLCLAVVLGSIGPDELVLDTLCGKGELLYEVPYEFR